VATPRHLKNAPIFEALIDIRAKLSKDTPMERFELLQPPLASKYPRKDRQDQFSGQIGMKEGQFFAEKKEMGFHGFIFRSSDELNVAQFRTDGFTFSRLRPYIDWESLREEARDLWIRYVETLRPESVTRVAVRYINRLNLPILSSRYVLEEYLNARPCFPVVPANELRKFILRVELVDEKLGLRANVTEVSKPGEQSESVNLILDIDAYKRDDFDVGGEAAWDALDQLRDFKNRIFFDSLTERTLGIFE
jgi:uncharacterized protein (TIGR04255 family)